MSYAGIILYMRPANERQQYIVMSSVIGRAYTQNYPLLWYVFMGLKAPATPASGYFHMSMGLRTVHDATMS